MILPTILLFGVLGYLFYTSKKEITLDNDNLLENQKDNDKSNKDLGDLFI